MSFFIIVDKILFIGCSLTVAYLFVFALFSLRSRKERYPVSPKKHRFLVIIPAYKEDQVIMDSVNSVLSQDYPADKIDLIVVSDRMTDNTNKVLSDLPLTLLKISPDRSTKGFALHYAVQYVKDQDYDIVVILDADNIVDNYFVTSLNDAFYSGSSAIQAHRVAKSITSEMAVLDAISEEINNSIFRKGHVNMGLSSALIGSGMAIDYKWFKSNCDKLITAGEDKELEIMLLKDGVYIDFLDNVMVYDEKISKEGSFYNQRRRWLASQVWSLYVGIRDLPVAIMKNNIDYIDKIIQWIMPPRIILLGVIIIMIVLTSFLDLFLSLWWWVLLFILLFSFALAVPDYLVNKKNIRAIKRLPVVFGLMVMNLFRLRGATSNFIHTKKG